MADDKPSMGNDPAHVTKLKQEVKRADAQKDRVADLNYHEYNNFVIDKTIQINTEIKKDQDRQSRKIMHDAAVEASRQMAESARGKTSFFFSMPDFSKNK